MKPVVSTLLELDEQGVAWISGTRVKVIEVALDKLAHGTSPEEMALQYPHLLFIGADSRRAGLLL